MTEKWILWRVLATLIVVGLLSAGGAVTYRAGWSQGYGDSQLAAEGEEIVPPSGPGHIGRPLAFMFGAGLLLKVVLGLVFFGVIFRLVRFVIWGGAFRPMMCGPGYRHWHPTYGRRGARFYHRRWMHGPMPPWCWDEPSEENVEPEADSGEAEA